MNIIRMVELHGTHGAQVIITAIVAVGVDLQILNTNIFKLKSVLKDRNNGLAEIACKYLDQYSIEQQVMLFNESRIIYMNYLKEFLL